MPSGEAFPRTKALEALARGQSEKTGEGTYKNRQLRQLFFLLDFFFYFVITSGEKYVREDISFKAG